MLGLILIASAETGFAQERSKVPQEVWQRAKEKGVINVIVSLSGIWQPERKLNQTAKLQQRKTIANTQIKLRAELAGTKHKVLRQYQTIAAVALEVEPYVLTLLEHSPHVIRVIEDKGAKVGLLQSAPLVGAVEAANAGFDGTGWTIAILDTGVDNELPPIGWTVFDLK